MKNAFRNQRGLLGPLYLILLVLAIALLGMMAFDYSHMVSVKAELQNATDAGALAGAAHLAFDVKNAEADALKFTAANTADGRSVSNESAGTKVTVGVTAPTAEKAGRVDVDASMQISHFLAKMIGRYTDTVTVHSAAGSSGLLWKLYADQAFPLAVSLDAIPSAKDFVGVPLSSLKIGDQFTIFIGAQGVKNAAFTSLSDEPANAAFVKSAVDQALGLSEKIEGFIPAVEVDQAIRLNDGMVAQMKLGKDPYLGAMQGKTLVLPVITGTPPFNQSRKVVAFIGYKVTGVSLHEESNQVEKLTGELVEVQLLGESKPEPATGEWPSGTIEKFSIQPVQLIE